MKKARRMHSASWVRDESFHPFETRRRIPWPVYSILIALAAWGALTLFHLGDDGTAESTRAPAAANVGNAEISAGERLFDRYCATCHQDDGIGIAGAIPPLDGSPFVIGNPDVPVGIVLMGISGPLTVRGSPYIGRMPTFRTLLSDGDIAAVLSYVRQAWSNDADPVTPEQVETMRTRLADRPAPLSGENAVHGLASIPSAGHTTSPPSE